MTTSYLLKREFKVKSAEAAASGERNDIKRIKLTSGDCEFATRAEEADPLAKTERA